MVKFDEEHDAKDCFPTLKMFHAFKAHRDAFYDLLESWKQSDNQLQLNRKKTEYIMKMLNEHNCSINMSKFAKLFVAQLINSSFEESKVIIFIFPIVYSCYKYSINSMLNKFCFQNVYKNKTIKDLSASKLELLHQRITKRDYTSGSSVNLANEFPGVQAFFKELIIILYGNSILCKHLIDTLVHRIDVLNTMDWASELQEGII